MLSLSWLRGGRAEKTETAPYSPRISMDSAADRDEVIVFDSLESRAATPVYFKEEEEPADNVIEELEKAFSPRQEPTTMMLAGNKGNAQNLSQKSLAKSTSTSSSSSSLRGERNQPLRTRNSNQQQEVATLDTAGSRSPEIAESQKGHKSGAPHSSSRKELPRLASPELTRSLSDQTLTSSKSWVEKERESKGDTATVSRGPNNQAKERAVTLPVEFSEPEDAEEEDNQNPDARGDSYEETPEGKRGQKGRKMKKLAKLLGLKRSSKHEDVNEVNEQEGDQMTARETRSGSRSHHPHRFIQKELSVLSSLLHGPGAKEKKEHRAHRSPKKFLSDLLKPYHHQRSLTAGQEERTFGRHSAPGSYQTTTAAASAAPAVPPAEVPSRPPLERRDETLHLPVAPQTSSVSTSTSNKGLQGEEVLHAGSINSGKEVSQETTFSNQEAVAGASSTIQTEKEAEPQPQEELAKGEEVVVPQPEEDPEDANDTFGDVLYQPNSVASFQVRGGTYMTDNIKELKERAGEAVAGLYEQFISGNDKYRNSRFKLIPSVVSGPWIVQNAVGSKPALLGNKVSVSYAKEQDYFEIDVDISSSRVAGQVCSICRGYASYIAVDIAFVLQGETCEELPEAILSVVRVVKPKLEKIAIPLSS